jgi:hypothetical protein
VQDSADAADLVNRFVGDVYDGLHGRYLHLSLRNREPGSIAKRSGPS